MALYKENSESTEIYKKICEMFESLELKYENDAEKFAARCTIQGEDIPISVNMQIDSEKKLIFALSYIPITIPEEKRIDMAIAVSVTNSKLVDGSFDFDIKEGNLFFRITNSYLDGKMGVDTLKYMFICAVRTIEDFNDKFMKLVEGSLKIDYFIADGN